MNDASGARSGMAIEADEADVDVGGVAVAADLPSAELDWCEHVESWLIDVVGLAVDKAARVDVRTQQVAWNAVEPFGFEDILRWQALGGVDDAPDAGLICFQITRHLAVTACLLSAGHERFKGGQIAVHANLNKRI